MIAIILTFLGIYTIVPCDYGFYMDVHGSHYEAYAPLEKLTNNYIQVDCNE